MPRASPTTLIAVLRAVAYSWQQQQQTENAQRIAEAGKDLFDRVSTFAGHLEGIGKHFRQATEAYNRAAGSWQARVVPAGRKMTDLGATPADQELPVLAHVDTSLRPLPAAELAAESQAEPEPESETGTEPEPAAHTPATEHAE